MDFLSLAGSALVSLIGDFFSDDNSGSPNYSSDPAADREDFDASAALLQKSQQPIQPQPQVEVAPPPKQDAASPPGVIDNAIAWMKSLSPASQGIIAGVAAGGAAGTMQALALRNAQQDAMERENRMIADRTRRGAIQPIAASAYTTRQA